MNNVYFLFLNSSGSLVSSFSSCNTTVTAWLTGRKTFADSRAWMNYGGLSQAKISRQTSKYNITIIYAYTSHSLNTA